jgi:hypothetical protein
MSRLLSIATVSVIAITALPLFAQQQSATAVNTVRPVVSRAALARAKELAFSSIQGNALTSTNGHMDGANVRLRDARFGRIVDDSGDRQVGLFAFKSIDPGSYIIEIVANDQSVFAASELLSIEAGEVVSAIVKLPFHLPLFGGIMGGDDQHGGGGGGGQRSQRQKAVSSPWCRRRRSALTVAVSPRMFEPTASGAPEVVHDDSAGFRPGGRIAGAERGGGSAAERGAAHCRKTTSIFSIDSRSSTATAACASRCSSSRRWR